MGSPIKENDTNFLYGRRGTLAEVNFDKTGINLIQNKNILLCVAEALGTSANNLSFHNGSMARVYPGCTGESCQFHIDTPGFLFSRDTLLDPSKFLVNVFIHLSDVNMDTAPMRVIPKSHLEYEKINLHLAKAFKRSSATNNIPQAGELWEELLPNDLEKPQMILGESGTTTFMHSSLLHGATENYNPDNTRDVVILNYSKRCAVEFHKKYFLFQKDKCKAFYKVNNKNAMFKRTFGPQYSFYIMDKRYFYLLLKKLAKNFKFRINNLIRPLWAFVKKKPLPINQSYKEYLNIGCGAYWYHKNTISIDFDPNTCDIGLDLNSAEKLPFPDNRFKGIYTSHCLEHLQEPKVILWLTECLRVLKPGGTIRIVLPDVGKYFQAYKERDASFFNWIRGKPGYFEDSWLRLIVRTFAEPTVDNYSDEEIYKMYHKFTLDEFLDFFNNQQIALSDRRLLLPHVHKSWWSSSKLLKKLSEIGFSNVQTTSDIKTNCDLFKEKEFFYKHPECSLYVEASKPV